MNTLGLKKSSNNTKILVAMSGGVDSSVVAAMLKKQGYKVFGATMRLYSQVDKVNKNKNCCAGRDIEDARLVAKQFDFPHYILDYQEEFYEGVIEDFAKSYAEGLTPIPCVKCNQTVKFENLLKFAKENKADALVTGHYVKSITSNNNTHMYRAIDKNRDQSYFLFNTTRKQLSFSREFDSKTIVQTFSLGNLIWKQLSAVITSFSREFDSKTIVCRHFR